MSRPDASVSGERMLFDADQLRWATRIPPKIPTPEPEEPWLQPIWRDAKGEYHYCRFDLIYRKFGKTIIHEVTFTYAGQHTFNLHGWCDWPHGQYFRYRLEGFLRPGWPQPKKGGAMAHSVPKGGRA